MPHFPSVSSRESSNITWQVTVRDNKHSENTPTTLFTFSLWPFLCWDCIADGTHLFAYAYIPTYLPWGLAWEMFRIIWNDSNNVRHSDESKAGREGNWAVCRSRLRPDCWWHTSKEKFISAALLWNDGMGNRDLFMMMTHEDTYVYECSYLTCCVMFII